MSTGFKVKNKEKTVSMKKAQHGKNENVAGSV
jgi:hypothetical protein